MGKLFFREKLIFEAILGGLAKTVFLQCFLFATLQTSKTHPRGFQQHFGGPQNSQNMPKGSSGDPKSCIFWYLGVAIGLAFATKQTPVGNRVRFSFDVDFVMDTSLFRTPLIIPFSAYCSNSVQVDFTSLRSWPLPKLPLGHPCTHLRDLLATPQDKP